MKRLLIGSFLIIFSVAILAVTKKNSEKEACKQNICCMKKCKQQPEISPKTDYIFWEPIGRLMMVPQ